MKTTKLLKFFAATLLSGTIATISLTANAAEENLYPGTACMTSNTATGANFFWGRNGLKNNSNVDRFVICPFVMDQNKWDASPSLQVEVWAFMPPSYGAPGKTGPKCFLRFLESNNTNTPTQVTIVNQTFTIDAFDLNAGFGDTDSGFVNVNVTNATDANGHVLCVVPKNGGQLLHYRVKQQ